MRAWKVLAAAFVAVWLAGPASAAIMTLTYAGFVDDIASDTDGVFGAPGASLSGLPIDLVVKYDTALGQRTTDPGVVDRVIGGSLFPGGFASPITGAYATINGVTASIFGDILGSVEVSANRHLVLIQGTGANGGVEFFSLESNVSGQPIDLEAPFSSPGCAPGDCSVRFVGANGGVTQGSVHFDTLVVTRAVPEPSAWALLIVGFGGAGYALRRRRVTVPG